MTTPNTRPDGSAVAPTWADNMSMANLNTALTANGSELLKQQSLNSQRFWSTPSRPADSGVIEVLQMTLASTRTINKIEFDAAIFPHDIYIEYYEEATRSWLPCLLGNAATPVPVHERIVESNPAVLPQISAITGHLHPQHSFSNHWRHQSYIIRPIETGNIRMLLSRTTDGTPPVSSLGQTVDYSLAIRNLYLGYSVESLADVPYKLPDPNSPSRGTFASTTDLFGSVVNFQVRVNEAKNVLRPAPNTPNALTTVWKSQPQPIPWAVVNFYVDARSPDGKAQVLDRFFVEPLFNGPSVNLYYSNSETTASFRTNSDPLPDTVAIVHNSQGVAGDVLHSTAPVGTIAFVDVDNRAIDFNASRNWWVGASLNFKFSHGTQVTTNPIMDFGEFLVSLTPVGLLVSTIHGDSLSLPLDPFDPATPLRFTVGYDGTNLRIDAKVGLVPYSGSMQVSVPLKDVVKTMRFGGFQQLAPQSGDFSLNSFILKVDDTLTDEIATDFIKDQDPYVLATTFMGVNDPKSDNVLLRYHPSFWTQEWRSGFIGGAPDRYHDLEWTPITRDYVLRTGYMYFDPTKAKYWKFEFTNLSPQVFEVYKPIVKTVQTFPPGMLVSSTPIDLSQAAQQQIIPGLANSYAVNGMTQILNGRQTVYVGTGGNGKTFTNTSARILTDTEVRARIGGAYWAWSFVPLHSVTATPAFEKAGKHTYEVINYQAQSKLAYFVGLRSLQAYRLSYASTDDTPQYTELFYDTNDLSNTTNWTLSGDHEMTSGQTNFAELRSNPLSSNKVITAVQFAAQQSESTQILPDDDFTDPAQSSWTKVGDAVITVTPSADQILGSSARIDRSLPPLTWDQVASYYTTWAAILAQNATWDMVMRGTNNPADSGGITSSARTTPAGGRIYAAARCTAPTDLTSPLYVQIVDEATGYVVSEASTDVRANSVAEWYTGFTISDGQGTIPFRWQDFSSAPSLIAFTDTFHRANATQLNAMDSGQSWVTPRDNSNNPISLAISANKAVVTSEGQYNTIDVGSPWGVLTFQVGTMGTTSAGEVMLAAIGPLFLDEKGVINNTSGVAFTSVRGNVLTTDGSARTVAANDIIKIESLPTKYVPLGKEDISITAGTDPVYYPYSLMITVNGTWVRTFSHMLGARALHQIKGRLNQQWISWNWQPTNYGALPGPVISSMPRVNNGAWLDSTTQTTWITASGRKWNAVGTWDTTTTVETTGRDDTGAPLSASSNGAVFWTDTGVWDGTMSTYIRNIAGTNGSTQPAGRHGYIMCLDYDHGVFVDYQGRVVVNGVVQSGGTLFTAPLPTGSTFAVQFVFTQNIAPANRGGIDPAVYPRVLVGRVNGSVTGTYFTSTSQSWTGTKRGLAGDLYDPTTGSRPGGASYTLDTSFRSFNWAPDATNVALVATTPLWQNVTRNGTVTYDQIAQDYQEVAPKYRARVVQKGPSEDIWDVDTLSMFIDPIVWSFSRDGGYIFYPAFDIRNNPNGILLFPNNIPFVDQNQKPGTSLVWRVLSYAPRQTLSSLVIRPWYGGTLSGVNYRPGLVATGPNVMAYDHFGAIENDSRFQTWNSPVPRSWWYKFRVMNRTQTGAPVPPDLTGTLYPSTTVYPDPDLYPGGSS
jgi:hypothetical protein